MNKKEKDQKLSLKKFQIAKINNPKCIIGGNSNNTLADDEDVKTGTAGANN